MSPTIQFIRIPGPIAYGEMLARQRERCEAVRAGEAPNTVFLLEHTPVITLGRQAHGEHILLDRAALAGKGIELIETDRGGDVTYHGPGQLVAYPILNLEEWRKSVVWYLRTLEGALIGLLNSYGLEGERVPGMTGVWVNGAKVAAIGVGVRRWVTYHGISLNVDPDMGHFECIVPCGLAGKPVTSLARLLGEAPEMDAVMARFEQEFTKVFGEAC